MNELRQLWDALQAAKARYEYLAMTNTVWQTPDAMFDLALKYRKAMREMIDAENAFAKAEREANR